MKRKKKIPWKELGFLCRTVVGLFLLFVVLLLLLRFPKLAAAGVSEGLQLCTDVLIPSLFPFLVVAAFFASSSYGRLCVRVLEKPTRLLFGLPGSAAAVLLFSVMGGFPVGASMIRSGVENQMLTRAQGRRLQLFCFCPGPAFVISAVGSSLLGSPRAGVLLEVSIVVPMLLLGIVLRFLHKDGIRTRNDVPAEKQPSNAQSFASSVQSGMMSMLTICAFVCLFSVVPKLLEPVALPQRVRVLLLSVLEITTGATRGAAVFSLPVFAALLSFGGFCSQCQILPTILFLRLKYWKFLLFRLLHAGTAALLCRGLLCLFPVEVSVFHQSVARLQPSASSSFAVSVCLLCMSALLLFGFDLRYRLRRA